MIFTHSNIFLAPIHTHCRYRDYKVYSDASITSLASKTSTRYSLESLFGVIFDVTMLSETDFLVCTFSSQVLRYHNIIVQDHNYYVSLLLV